MERSNDTVDGWRLFEEYSNRAEAEYPHTLELKECAAVTLSTSTSSAQCMDCPATAYATTIQGGVVPSWAYRNVAMAIRACHHEPQGHSSLNTRSAVYNHKYGRQQGDSS